MNKCKRLACSGISLPSISIIHPLSVKCTHTQIQHSYTAHTCHLSTNQPCSM